MDSAQRQQWQTILKLTQQMRELAVPNQKLAELSVDEAAADHNWAKQPWQAISALELERLQLLKDFFSNKADSADTETIAEGIAQIQAIDKELLLISQQIQKDIGQSFSRLGNSQRAASAYASNAGQ